MPPQCWLLQAQGHSRLTMSSYMTPGMGAAPGMSMPNMGAQQMMSRTQLGSQMGAGAGSYGGNPSLAELQQLQGLSGGLVCWVLACTQLLRSHWEQQTFRW